MMKSYFSTLFILAVCTYEVFTHPTTEDSLQTPDAECLLDCDCSDSTVCVDRKCKDPCDGACGNNTECHILGRVPFCRCKHCFVGDPLESCTRQESECKEHSDCPSEESCQQGKCVNPCVKVCGDNTDCLVRNHLPVCSCKTGYSWTVDAGCKPDGTLECNDDQQCPVEMSCRGHRCANPCNGVCGVNAVCRATNHYPVCTCSPGYTGDPFTSCKPKCTNINGTETNKAFFLIQELKNRKDAFQACRSLGMTLVSITSDEKQKQVEQFLAHKVIKLGDVWSSGIRTSSNLSVLWANGRSDYASYGHFSNLWNYGDCIELRYSAGYKWRISSCGYTDYALCEEDCEL